MKHCTIFILVSLCAVMRVHSIPQQASPRQGFELKGDIVPLKSSWIELDYYQGKKRIRDSAKVVNGKFIFKGTLIEPSMAILSDKGGKFFRYQFIENARMTISQKDSISETIFKGSKTEIEHQLYKAMCGPAMDRYVNLSTEVSFVKDSAVKARRELEEVKPAYRIYADSVKRFIAAYPHSFVSLYKITDISHEVPMEEFKAVFHSLDNRLQQGPMAADIVKDIKRYDTYFNQPAADFTQNDDNGNPIRLSSYRGKYVLIDFWASWCVPCRRENPNLLKAYEKYKQKGFEVLGVSIDDNEKVWKAAVAKDQLPWAQVSELNGRKNTAAIKYYVTGIPANFLVNPDGIIIDMDLRGKKLEAKLAEIFN